MPWRFSNPSGSFIAEGLYLCAGAMNIEKKWDVSV
jgi:hypothetical protein